MTMKRTGEEFKRASRVGAAALAMLLIGGPLSMAIAGGNQAPGPLIGMTGPYGILAAGVGYGGYLLFKRLKSRG
jgi:hypothetical protein